MSDLNVEYMEVPVMVERGPNREVIVIGAGLVGLCTAFFLRRAGLNVTVVERDQLGSGASRGNAGEITPLTAVPLAGPGMIGEVVKGLISRSGPLTLSPLRAARLMTFGFGFMKASLPRFTTLGVTAMTQLGAGAIAAFDELAASGVELSGGGSGFLYTAKDAATVAAFRSVLVNRSRLGVAAEPGKLMTGPELHSLEPTLSSRCSAGFIDHGAKWIDPATFVQSLGDVLIADGVQVLAGCRVTGINVGKRPSVDYLNSGMRHRLAADHLVLAAGAWSGELVRTHGVHLGVVPGKGYSFTVPAQELPRHLIHLADARTVLVPMSGRLRVVGAMEIDGSYDAFHSDRIDMIKRVTAPLVRGINWTETSQEWVGPRPMTADGLPIIGQHRRLPGVTLATGHNMHGLSLGPVTGKVVAALLTGHSIQIAGRDLEAAKFAPSRLHRMLT